MISTPRYWSSTPLANGLLLRPPNGRSIAVHYTERVRPLRTAAGRIDAELAELADFEPDAPPRSEHLATDEGEHASFATISGRRGDQRCQLDLGFVVVDDYYSRLVGLASDPADYALASTTVRQLVHGDRHWRAQRPRPFWYEMPDGWTPIERTGQLDWINPDVAGRPLLLTAWPAMPRSAGASTGLFVARLLGRDRDGGWTERRPIDERAIRAGDLGGVCLRLRGGFPGAEPTDRLIAALEDADWVYTLRLEAAGALTDLEVATFDQVVASIEPLPKTSRAADVSAALAHWGG